MITLKRPFAGLDGKLISAVNPKVYLSVGDLLFARRYSATDETAQTIALAARVCALDMSEIESMALEDLEVITAHIAAMREQADPKV